MTPEIDAIKHIEAKAVAMSDAFNGKPTDYPTRTLPANMEIHNLEEFQANRNYFKAKMNTRSIKDFIAYFKLYEGKNCYVSSESMIARTIFDLGTKEKPLHCKHRAVLQLHQTALFKSMEHAALGSMSQKDLAEWIEEWHDNIAAKVNIEDQEGISLSKTVAAIRRLTIEEAKHSTHETGNFRASKTALESIEAKADEGMPGYLAFKCVPYEGLAEREFLLRINIIKSHDNPEFKLRILQHEAVKEEMVDEFRDLLVGSLPDDCETFVGSLEV